MTSTSTASETKFLTAQRKQLLARRESYLADVARSTATALELTEDGANQDSADEDGFGEGDTLNVERDRLLVVASEAEVAGGRDRCRPGPGRGGHLRRV